MSRSCAYPMARRWLLGLSKIPTPTQTNLQNHSRSLFCGSFVSLSMPVPLGSGFLDSTSTSNTGITPSVGTMNRCQSFSSASSSSDLPYHLVVGLPALSPTMESGTLAEWYLKEGDYFAAGEAIAKIETDKAAMDFEAQDDGFVAKILVSAGQGNDIPIGTPIMITVEDAADISAFVNYTPPLLKDEGSTTKSCIMESAGSPTAAAADAGAPVAVPNMAPAVVVAPPPPTVAVAVTLPSSTPLEGGLVFSTAWGVSVDSSSPLAHTLAKEQRDYIAAYGVTGQSPIQ